MPSIQMWWYIRTHPCGNVPVWTYDCHQLVMPKWCQEKLHLSYSLSDFMAHDWFRDTPVLLFFGHSHNMLAESWGYIMKHMTFHDKSPSWKFTDFLYWPGFCCFPVAHNASVAYLIYAWFLNAFCCKNLMIQSKNFPIFPNLWIGMIGFSL